jgi:hypothetical protein
VLVVEGFRRSSVKVVDYAVRSVRPVSRIRHHQQFPELPMGWRRDRSDLPSRPLHVLHIGKTGGTALKHALLEQRSVSGYELLLHGHDVTVADIPHGEKLIFALRDPLSRFVSAFNGRLREGRPRYYYPWREEERIAFAVFQTPDDLAVALSSRDRKRRERAERAMRGIGHLNVSYQHWFGDEQAFRSRVPDIFFIAFQDQLDEDFELLKRKLRLSPDLRLPRDEVDAHRMPAGFSNELGQIARANLQRWYAHDIAFVDLCRELASRINVAETTDATSKDRRATRRRYRPASLAADGLRPSSQRPATRFPRSVVALARALVVALVAIVAFVALPEGLADRPYDPRPSRII